MKDLERIHFAFTESVRKGHQAQDLKEQPLLTRNLPNWESQIQKSEILPPSPRLLKVTEEEIEKPSISSLETELQAPVSYGGNKSQLPLAKNYKLGGETTDKPILPSKSIANPPDKEAKLAPSMVSQEPTSLGHYIDRRLIELLAENADTSPETVVRVLGGAREMKLIEWLKAPGEREYALAGTLEEAAELYGLKIDDILTVQDVANELVNITSRTIQRWALTGLLPPLPVRLRHRGSGGGKYLFSREAVERAKANPS